MSKETGGPAFPFVSHGGCHEHQYCDPGMELRDYFAAKAMASVPLTLDPNEQKLISNAAYSQADAMIAARNT
ncbi:hypothetical protein SOASR014_42060 [Pectobacterium carotovorum subsp. carotovorum]|nr:hypothetical protein SOASR014_42060 [Pectobacterium carotovorum subsp. carotovorum]GLX46517.1 hypothetical protein Pcaca01_41850 [Pectobacterium carotovorum subsp. carotovorum]